MLLHSNYHDLHLTFRCNTSMRIVVYESFISQLTSCIYSQNLRNPIQSSFGWNLALISDKAADYNALKGLNPDKQHLELLYAASNSGMLMNGLWRSQTLCNSCSSRIIQLYCKIVAEGFSTITKVSSFLSVGLVYSPALRSPSFNPLLLFISCCKSPLNFFPIICSRRPSTSSISTSSWVFFKWNRHVFSL